ncbi:hypothetical protein [Paenibacillus sp. ISL-20]|nr:hypothetical protein [Paenibacillus sp. ISL-20]
MKLEKVFEYDISNELEAKIQELLIDSFPEVYPRNRIYLSNYRMLDF